MNKYEALLQVFTLEEIMEEANVDAAAVLEFLFEESNMLADFPEELWPL